MSIINPTRPLAVSCQLPIPPSTKSVRPHLYMQWERVNGRLVATWLRLPD